MAAANGDGGRAGVRPDASWEQHCGLRPSSGEGEGGVENATGSSLRIGRLFNGIAFDSMEGSSFPRCGHVHT